MSGKYGTKETREFLIGICTLAGFIMHRLSDGKVSLGDAFALARMLLSKKFRNAMIDAVQGLEQIPKELLEMDKADLSELADVIRECADPLAEALSKGAEIAAAPEPEEDEGDA